MAFAENLLEGLANATGSTGTVNRIEKDKADRRATQHEELAAQTQSVLDDVGGLQKQRAQLDPNHPEYDKQLKANDEALHNARQVLTDLYHPAKNPDALQHLGGFIRKHLSRNQPRAMDEKPTPGDFKEMMSSRLAGLDAAAAAPGSGLGAVAKPLTGSKPYKGADGRYYQSMLAPNGTVTATPMPEGYQPPAEKAPKLSDYQQGLRRSVAGQGGDPETITPEQEAQFRKNWKGSASKFSQEAAVYEQHWGKHVDQWTPEQLTYFNQKMAYDSRVNRESTTTKLVKDEYGHTFPVEVSTESGPGAAPVEPGAAPAAGIPKTPAEAKARIRPHSHIKVGNDIGITQATPGIEKAQTERNGAVALSTVADEMAKKPNDAINVKGFAIALERARAGRYTDSALDRMLDAGWGNKLEQWAAKPTTGSYPADIIRQLVDGAHENLKGKEAALVAAHGPGGGAATAQPSTQAASGKAVSLAKAKLLPAMKGKSDDEVRKAIEASGHTVKP